MQHELVADERGRVTLPPEMRKRHGRRFIPIDMPDGIHLFPVPAGTKWLGKHVPAKDAKRIAMEEAEKEVDEELRTIHGVRLGGKR